LNLESIATRVPTVTNLATIEYEIETGRPYLDIPDVISSLWEAAHGELRLLENAGLSPFLFEMSATVTPERATVLFAPRIIGQHRARHSQMLGDGRGVALRFDKDGVVKGGALLPLSRKGLLEAVMYSNRKTYSLIILSSRKDFCSEENLRQIFPLASMDFDGKLSNRVNEGLVSALICPRGDAVIKTHGEFDDTGRDLQFIFDLEKCSTLSKSY
jgi:hypothetical protein